MLAATVAPKPFALHRLLALDVTQLGVFELFVRLGCVDLRQLALESLRRRIERAAAEALDSIGIVEVRYPVPRIEETQSFSAWPGLFRHQALPARLAISS
jgi:hypothetical protein